MNLGTTVPQSRVLAGFERNLHQVREGSIIAVVVLAIAMVKVAHSNPMLDTLISSYPDQLAGYENGYLLWKDGTRMPVSDERREKTFEELLKAPDILDQFAIRYPLGTPATIPRVNEDPGRIRNEAFFRKMYGDCEKGEVARQLSPAPWLPNRGGGTVLVTAVNGVAEKLAAVSRELSQLPSKFSRYLVPSEGAYNCRVIADTNRPSMHAFGAAIDLNSRFGDYWLWTKSKEGKFDWKNRIPLEIVDVFERHQFIWGGKWFHYDTMHFEYRPEIIAHAKKGWPERP
jgi:D-alanyl-D-alanine carboxypeptidase